MIADEYKLGQNYPNPFNPETVIRYHMERKETATLAVYNVAGKWIRDLCIDRLHTPDYHEISWDCRNASGEPVSGGIYFYRLSTPSLVVTNKMLLLK